MSEHLKQEMSAVRKRRKPLFIGYGIIIVLFAAINTAQTNNLADFLPNFLRYLSFFVVILIWTTVALIGTGE